MPDTDTTNRGRSDTGPFVIVPCWLVDSDVSHGAVRLYAVLSSYADNQSGKCWPSRSTLAERLGASVDSIDRWGRELVDSGALVIHRRSDPEGGSRSNLYFVHRVNPVAAPAPDGGRTDAEGGSRTGTAQTRSSSELEETPRDSGDVRTVFDAWVGATHRDPSRTKLDARRRRLIEKALDGYPVGDVVAAVQGWEQSPWHAGENPKGKVYNDLGLVLRDSEKIEYFRDCAGGMPVMELVSSAAEQAWDDVLAVVARFGRTHKPEWEDPKVRPALQAIGGYWEVCNAVNVGPLRAGFVAAYREQP